MQEFDSCDGRDDCIFASSEPRNINLARASSWVNLTEHLMVFDSCPSETPSCLDLSNGTLVQAPTALEDGSPVYTILKALRNAGWSAYKGNGSPKHTSTSPKQYNTIRMANKPLYLKCCLTFDAVLALGVAVMPSTAQAGYYSCLLAKKVVPPNLSAKQFKEVLDGKPLAAVMAALPVPAPAALEHDDGIGEASDSDDVLMADADEHSPLPPLVVADPAVAVVPAPAVAVPDVNAEDVESDEILLAGEEDDSIEMPSHLGGGRLHFEDCFATWGYYRFILQCAHHPNCQKKRNGGVAQTANFGVYEPLGYLAVWQDMGSSATCTQEVHNARAFEVPLEPQRRWLVEHGYIEDI